MSPYEILEACQQRMPGFARTQADVAAAQELSKMDSKAAVVLAAIERWGEFTASLAVRPVVDTSGRDHAAPPAPEPVGIPADQLPVTPNLPFLVCWHRNALALPGIAAA